MSRVQVYAGHLEKKNKTAEHKLAIQLLNIWLKLGIMWENI